MSELIAPLLSWTAEGGHHPLVGALGLTIALVLAVLLAFHLLLPAVARRSKTDIDDRILAILERPAVVSAVLIGGWAVLDALRLAAGETGRAHPWVRAGFASLAILYWTVGLSRSAAVVLDGLSRRGTSSWVQVRTLPLLDIFSKILFVGGGIYLVCLAWGLDLTAWVASAGIVGIAVGFAAKDTLSNLFAGIFILVDVPYRLGDYLVLETGERGYVTDIGMRTTRLMTRDDIQIIVPNAAMANSKIVNETGGHTANERVRCQISVAYGSDVDRVRAVLMELAAASEDLAGDPPPRVRFRALGASGLDFELLGWIEEPALRGQVLDRLYTAVYKRFLEEKIEIPYPKRDVYLHRVDEG